MSGCEIGGDIDCLKRLGWWGVVGGDGVGLVRSFKEVGKEREREVWWSQHL